MLLLVTNEIGTVTTIVDPYSQGVGTFVGKMKCASIFRIGIA